MKSATTPGGEEKWICTAILDQQHSRTVRSIAWSPDSTRLACASFDATTSLWQNTHMDHDHSHHHHDHSHHHHHHHDDEDDDEEEWECVATMEGHENEVKSVDWDCSGTFFATCSRDKSVWVWEDANPSEPSSTDFECASVLNGHSQDVKAVVWHPREQILASASYDDTVKIWMVVDVGDDDWSCADTLVGHSSTVWSISFNSTGNMLASASDDLTVKIWKRYNPKNKIGITVPSDKPFIWKNICTISGAHSRTIFSVDWNKAASKEEEEEEGGKESNNNNNNNLPSFLIATGSADDCIRIFGNSQLARPEDDHDQPSLIELARIDKAHDSDVNCVKWSPVDPTLLASTGDDGVVKLWRFIPEGTVEVASSNQMKD